MEWGTFAERSARLGETLEILHQAFADERIDFGGTHFTVRGMPIKPGPVQQPRPPIIVGGVGEKYTLPMVSRYADVWNVPTYALGELEHKLTVLRLICGEIGRDPASIVLSVEAVMALAPDDASLPKVRQFAEKRFGVPAFGLYAGGLIGTPPAIVDRLHELQELGFAQIVLFTHDRGSDETLELFASDVLARLKGFCAVIDRVRCRSACRSGPAGARCAPFVGRLSSQTAGRRHPTTCRQDRPRTATRVCARTIRQSRFIDSSRC